LAQEAYLAGLLHDIGKLLIITALDEASACSDFGLTLSDQLVDEVISAMHIEQGVQLVTEWNLPEKFAQVIDDHHDDEVDTQDIVVSLVKLANNGCRKTGLGMSKDPELVLPTTAEAQFLGIDEITLAEYEIMLEDQFLEQTGQTQNA
jgi:putative nucleotidyltransferase with HDIG domain